MRGKRSKQYRKLMDKYQRSFNFREPYQVLVDAEMVKDAAGFSMNLPLFLERTLHGKIKPMITQCSIRHLYTAETTDKAKKDAWIDTAKTFERRRCGHHTLDEPLSALECINSSVDPKSSKTNKNRYVVASQDPKVRASMRQIAGVPLVYLKRSVMIMEPMAEKSEEIRDTEERAKFRAGLKGRRGGPEPESLKRKRSDEDGEDDTDAAARTDGPAETQPMPKKKRKGPKGPNPLSVKKTKKTAAADVEQEKQAIRKAAKKDPQAEEKALDVEIAVDGTQNESTDAPAKRKRRRKHKTGGGDDAPGEDALGESAPDVAV